MSMSLWGENDHFLLLIIKYVIYGWVENLRTVQRHKLSKNIKITTMVCVCKYIYTLFPLGNVEPIFDESVVISRNVLSHTKTHAVAEYQS